MAEFREQIAQKLYIGRPREGAAVIALRAGLRTVPLLTGDDSTKAYRGRVLLFCFRALSFAWNVALSTAASLELPFDDRAVLKSAGRSKERYNSLGADQAFEAAYVAIKAAEAADQYTRHLIVQLILQTPLTEFLIQAATPACFRWSG